MVDNSFPWCRCVHKIYVFRNGGTCPSPCNGAGFLCPMDSHTWLHKRWLDLERFRRKYVFLYQSMYSRSDFHTVIVAGKHSFGIFVTVDVWEKGSFHWVVCIVGQYSEFWIAYVVVELFLFKLLGFSMYTCKLYRPVTAFYIITPFPRHCHISFL